MKVALCLSGQYRSFRRCAESIKKHVIDPLDCDVFFHTWNEGRLDYHKMYQQRQQYAPLSEDDKEYALEILKPVSHIFEPDREFDYAHYENAINSSKRHCAWPYRSIMSMFYSIQQADLLRRKHEEENNFQYDYVIRSRFDLMYKIEIPEEWFDPNTIHTPSDSNNIYNLNDHFAVGNSDVMTHYGDCFSLMKDAFDEGLNFHPGVILSRVLINKGVSVACHLKRPYSLTR